MNSPVTTLSPSVTAVAGSADRSFLKALLALGVGGFSIGTGEFVIMGLLPDAAVLKIEEEHVTHE